MNSRDLYEFVVHQGYKGAINFWDLMILIFGYYIYLFDFFH